MNEKLDIITIGESLIELSSDVSLSLTESLNKYYGGDTLTAAIAAKRLGSKVGYITRVGCDYFKEFLLDSWQSEGLDISQIKLTDDFNGLYLLARPKNGDKEFSYYRKKTAACKLSIEDISENYIKNAKIFYTSGIAQSLSLSAKEAIKKAYQIAKENGVTTAYDPNFTSLLMTPEESKENFEEVISDIDILFLSAKTDTPNVLEVDSCEKAIKNLWDLGVNIVVIKSSKDKGYYTGYGGDIVFNPFFADQTVDTTCSSDTFNGGFLHGLASGLSPFEAVKLASVTAGLQAQGLGAVKSIPYGKEVYAEYEKI